MKFSYECHSNLIQMFDAFFLRWNTLHRLEYSFPLACRVDCKECKNFGTRFQPFDLIGVIKFQNCQNHAASKIITSLCLKQFQPKMWKNAMRIEKKRLWSVQNLQRCKFLLSYEIVLLSSSVYVSRDVKCLIKLRQIEETYKLYNCKVPDW